LRLAVLFLLVCIIRRTFWWLRKKRCFGYILDSPVPAEYPTRELPRLSAPFHVTIKLWSAPIRHNPLRSPLHSGILVVIFFPVPPSTRQAAGPLTENLPHVCLSDRKPVDLSLERPSPRGTKRRLSTRVLPTATAVKMLAVWIDVFEDLEGQNSLGANAMRPRFAAAAKRLTTKRGHLA
jgi:hypothetical protein